VCKAREPYILQQCNCVARRPHGLSQTIAGVLGADPYTRGTRNTAAVEARPIPGSILVLPVVSAAAPSSQAVVCLFGQVGMGKPGAFSNFGVPDTAADRVRYFCAALEQVAKLPFPDRRAVAVPQGIGCGLAGGRWDEYARALARFDHTHGIECVVVPARTYASSSSGATLHNTYACRMYKGGQALGTRHSKRICART
jgi:hypothetical protein